MTDPVPTSGRRMIVIAALSVMGGIIGTVGGRALGATLHTSPAWMGPAIMFGVLAVAIASLLLAPAIARGIRSKGRNAAP